MLKKKHFFHLLFLITIIVVSISASFYYQEEDGGDFFKGAQIYYSWDHFFEDGDSIDNHPLWEGSQVAGIETWRCVSCHNWDYSGVEDYPGVKEAAQMSDAEVLAWLDGSQNDLHDFSNYFTVSAIEDITEFLKNGVTDYSEIFVNGEIVGANVNRGYGEELYKQECLSCHATDGSKINFGTAANPLFVGDIGFDEPKKMLHVVRYGHLEISTQNEKSLGWELNDSLSLVGYTELLPLGQKNGVELLDDFDYDEQGETTDMVNLAFALVTIVLITVSYTYYKERN